MLIWRKKVPVAQFKKLSLSIRRCIGYFDFPERMSILSLSLSLSLLQTVWTQKIADTLGIFTYLKRGFSIHVYEPARCFVQNLNESLKCRRTFVTYHMRQRLRPACANVHSQYNVTHIPASTQSQATIGPPAKCHSNGESLAGWWWPSLDKVGESMPGITGCMLNGYVS